MKCKDYWGKIWCVMKNPSMDYFLLSRQSFAKERKIVRVKGGAIFCEDSKRVSR
jgi:hypothetical protein